jgi:hydroxymethylbilane synthase
MNTREDPIRLATRGSDLALRQAAAVKEALEARRHAVEVIEVETTGDRISEELIHRLGKTGAFVRALDERVLEGDCDAAVHSMKDVPTEMPPELVVAGVPERASAGDVLLTPTGGGLDALPEGAVVGTSSLRRRAELLAARPDLEVRPLRGNVDTRVEKLLAPRRQREHERRLAAAGELDADAGENEADDADPDDAASEDVTDEPAHTEGYEQAYGEYERTPQEWFEALSEVERRALGREVDTEYDAIVLAAAGLERAGLARQLDVRELPAEEFVPAPGQGALAVTARDDERGELLHDALDHPRTRVETTVERVVLSTLGGGCIAPMGAHAVVQGEYVHAAVRVLDRDGEEEIGATRDLSVERHPEAARELAAELAERGAADLIAAARVDTDTEGEPGAKRIE